MFFDESDQKDSRRSLPAGEKETLYLKAGKKCQNPACGKKLEFFEMQVGHKTAWSKNGRTTLANSVCLCYVCNKRQGTKTWAAFLKSQGHEDPKLTLKKGLQALTLVQLKDLAKKHNVKLNSRVVEDLFDSRKVPPTKSQYVNKLSGVVTEKEIEKISKETPTPARKPVRKVSDDSWF
jgi:hypothetical protein